MAFSETPTQVEATSTPRLVALSEWNKLHPWPSVPALRAMIAKNHNGFVEACIKRFGRRVLVDEAAFFRFVEAQNGGAR